MSYDVSIGNSSFNYTYNMAPLFHACIKGESNAGILALDGLTGAHASRILADAFDRAVILHCEGWDITRGCDAFRKRFDAPNKWGSTDGALIFMAQIMAACHANPRKRVRVS